LKTLHFIFPDIHPFLRIRILEISIVISQLFPFVQDLVSLVVSDFLVFHGLIKPIFVSIVALVLAILPGPIPPLIIRVPSHPPSFIGFCVCRRKNRHAAHGQRRESDIE
jgi:hypothetical protein